MRHYLYYRNCLKSLCVGECVILANIMLLAGVSIEVLITIHFKTFIDKKVCPTDCHDSFGRQVWHKRDSK